MSFNFFKIIELNHYEQKVHNGLVKEEDRKIYYSPTSLLYADILSSYLRFNGKKILSSLILKFQTIFRLRL